MCLCAKFLHDLLTRFIPWKFSLFSVWLLLLPFTFFFSFCEIVYFLETVSVCIFYYFWTNALKDFQYCVCINEQLDVRQLFVLIVWSCKENNLNLRPNKHSHIYYFITCVYGLDEGYVNCHLNEMKLFIIVWKLFWPRFYAQLFNFPCIVEMHIIFSWSILLNILLFFFFFGIVFIAFHWLIVCL